MDSNNVLKEIEIKNRTCYYFDDIIEIENSDPDNISIGEKSHENILVFNISYKTSVDCKPLHIRFDNGFIRVYDGTRYLVLFGRKKYDSIYNRIR